MPSPALARPRPRPHAAPVEGVAAALAYARAHGPRFVEELAVIPDDGMHAPDEKMHLPNFHRGVETSIRMMERLARLPVSSTRAARRPRPA
jgi:acetylornithine deacetylase/succinyl-diaminopimelate desuccinylase-like protein